MASEAQNSEVVNSEEEKDSNSYPVAEQSSNIYKSICHTCPPDSKVRKRDQKRLIAASIFCLLFMVAEIVGGILSNSLAILSDAGHMLTDFGAFMISLTALWLSSKPQTSEMSFGFHRAEVLGALISVLSIWLITGILAYMAVQRLLDPDYELDALIMIYVSVGGTLANLLMGAILMYYKGGEPVDPENEEENTLNIRSAMLHVVGDLLQSIAVLIASLVIYFYPNMKYIDPICTFVFSFIILITTIFIMRDILRVLMEGFPKHMDFSEVRNVLYSIPGVVKIHNMRMWSLTMDKVALSAHIIMRETESQSDVLKRAMRIINNNFNIYEVTLQIEEEPVNMCSTCA